MREITSLRDLPPGVRRQALSRVTWSWVYGAIWATTIGGAPLTVFAHGLGATELHFGLLIAMPFLATLLSLPASLLIDASGQRKRIFMVALLTQRLAWLGIALVPTLIVTLGHDAVSPKLALVTFLGLMVLHHVTGAIGGPAWVSWMADLVPGRVRGRYFARRRQWGIVSSVPAAWVAGLVLDLVARSHASGPHAAIVGAAALFAVTACAGIADIVMFAFVPDVAPRRDPAAKAARPPILRPLMRPLADRHFVWFCLYVAVLTMAVAPIGQFANLYLVERLGVSSTQVQLMMLVAPLAGQFLVVPIWGRMADRFGRKPMMAISTFGLVPVGLGWCVMNLGHPTLGYVLSVSGAMLWAAVEIANFNLVLSMSGNASAATAQTKNAQGGSGGGGGSGYTSVNGVISAIAGVVGGLGAGWLMWACRDVHTTLGLERLGVSVAQPFGAYEILFAASALLRLAAGLVFLPRLHEPRARPTSEALAFGVQSLAESLRNLVAVPARRLAETFAPEPMPTPALAADLEPSASITASPVVVPTVVTPAASSDADRFGPIKLPIAHDRAGERDDLAAERVRTPKAA